MRKETIVIKQQRGGCDKGLKLKRLLILSTATSLLALSLFVLLSAGYYVGYHYYSLTLTPPISPGDCAHSAKYSNVLDIAAGIVSATPSGYWLAAGYVYPLDGTPVVYVLYAPGYGPHSGAGTWYGIWGNVKPPAQGGTTEYVNAVVRIVSNNPIPQRAED